jgi:hypothetical protein
MHEAATPGKDGQPGAKVTRNSMTLLPQGESFCLSGENRLTCENGWGRSSSPHSRELEGFSALANARPLARCGLFPGPNGGARVSFK